MSEDIHDGHSHDCGCDHEESTITLTLDDGAEVECSVLTIFPIGDKEYIALLPEDDDYVLFYQFLLDGEDPVLELIEDDDEYNMVIETFDAILDEEDFEYDDEDFDDDEEDDLDED